VNLFGGSNTLGLQLTDVTTSPGIGYIFLGSYTGPSVPGDSGTVSFAPVAVVTPEPSSVALMLLGVALVSVMRKRIALGLP
jgi:PEP-CTERM motif